MKRLSKRTLAWGVLTVGVLATAAFADDYAFVNGDSKEAVASAESNEEVLKLLLTDEDSSKLGLITAGASSLNFKAEESTQESVLANPTVDAGKAGVATLEAKDVPVVTAVWESPWNGRAIAVVEEGQANVRAAAAEDSELVGKIKKGDDAEVVEQGAEWSLIKSGNVNGYIKNEFLVFGSDAEARSEELGKRIATVQAEGLNVRKQPSEEAEICEQAKNGKQYSCAKEENGWIAVYLASGETGYINAQYASEELTFGKAITVEEEQAQIKAAEEAAKKAAKEKAEKEAQLKAKKEAANAVTKIKKSAQTVAATANVDDVTLLAALIEMEAGTNYEGGVAVGNVVMNRVHSSSYPNSISGVIYQRGQFPGAHNGKLAKILARGPKSTCVNAAQAAMNGDNIIGDRLHFNSQKAAGKRANSVTVGGNCFF